jgi:hypothetical protein
MASLRNRAILVPLTILIRLRSIARTNAFQSSWAAFWVAFLLRLFLLTWKRPYRFLVTLYPDHRNFGWEMGRIAHALVSGRGYADPFFGHTGPTAWVAPLYPLLMAAVFKVCGDESILSAWFMLAFNCFVFAIITRTIYEIAARYFNRRTASWAAWIWVFYPTILLFMVWETILSTWLFTCIVVLALRMRGIGEDQEIPALDDPRTLGRWLLFGLLWALLALSNPSLLLFLPACGFWILNPKGNFPKIERIRQLRFAAFSVLLFILCTAPWVARNWIIFHRLIPMRSDFGAEFYLGNGPGAHGFSMVSEHPFQSPEQFQLYKQMGELAYSRMRGQLAWKYVEAHPEHFFWNTLRRIVYFWTGGPITLHGSWYARAHQMEHAAQYPFASITGLLGLALALKRRVPGITLFAWAFLLIPLTYYVTAVDARFRFPLDPLIVVLAVYLFQSITQMLSKRRKAGCDNLEQKCDRDVDPCGSVSTS